MYLVHYWTGRNVWTGPDEGSGRSMAWMEQYLSGLYPQVPVLWIGYLMMRQRSKHLIGSL